MANAKQCDICGEFFKINDDDKLANRMIFTYCGLPHIGEHHVASYDICPKCNESIAYHIDCIKKEGALWHQRANESEN